MKVSHYFNRQIKALCRAIVQNGKQAPAYTAEELATREAKETIHDEWHRTPDLRRKLTAIIRHVYDPTGDKDLQILIAHHLCFKCGDEGEEKEIASVETMIFDHDFLKKVYGDEDWFHMSHALVLMKPEERVNHLYERLSS